MLVQVWGVSMIVSACANVRVILSAIASANVSATIEIKDRRKNARARVQGFYCHESHEYVYMALMTGGCQLVRPFARQAPTHNVLVSQSPP